MNKNMYGLDDGHDMCIGLPCTSQNVHIRLTILSLLWPPAS